jgi:hydroxymethylpyrimidine kinase/phosphomethylpyrimidine kinase
MTKAHETVERPGVLLLAGLDPSGGAGFIADVRVAELLATRPVGVVTALTEQTTAGVRACHPVDAETVGGQLAELLADVAIAAAKIGLVPDDAVARAIGEALALTAAPVVWDPVLRPSAGVPFYRGDLAAAVASLRPHITLITPNADEAALLTGRSQPVTTRADARAAAEALVELGFPAVLVKGGHLEVHTDGTLGEGELDGQAPVCIDVLAERIDGAIRVTELRGMRLALPPGGVHGTGCALSTAIACGLATGLSLLDACRAAKSFVEAHLAHPVRPGRGAAALL